MISVIIPSYNHENYIKDAIDSILNQTFQDFEIIIIDDGSSDNTKNVLGKYDDSRITLICQENQGAHNAINRGLMLSKGTFISILNSDDFFEKKYFESAVRYLENNQDVDFISSDINIVDENSNKLGVKKSWYNMLPWEVSNPEKSMLSYNSYVKSLVVSNFISTTTNMFFRRTILDSVGLMRNLRFVHDWDFALRVAKKHKMHHLSLPLVNYRIHGNNTISKNRNWMMFELLWIWACHFEFFSNLILQDTNRDNIKHSFDLVMNSFNFQGNEKVALSLFWQMQHLRFLGYDEPEKIYLDDVELRESLLVYINC